MLDANSPPVDVLISDGRMPDGTGIDLIRSQLACAGDRCVFILMTATSTKAKWRPIWGM